jgi:hypothetical protein
MARIPDHRHPRARCAVGDRNSSRRPITVTTLEAIEHADWFARYALDRLPDDPDAHPGIQGHLTAARVQLDAALKLAAPSQQRQRAA